MSLSLNQTLLKFLLSEINLDDSIGSGNFSVRGYLPFIRKDSSTHMYGLAVYVKWLPFAWALSLENSADSCFQLALLHSLSYFFFLAFVFVHGFLILFHLSSEVLFINPSANVFVFGDFNVHHKDLFTYSGRTDQLGKLCYNFSIWNDLTLMVNFPTRIPDCGFHSPALLNLFISFDASICSAMAFPPLGNSYHVVFSVSNWLSRKLKTGCPVSSHSSWLLLYWLGWSLWSFERCSMGGYL